MQEEINSWGDYRTKVREFDAVLEHGKAVAAAEATEKGGNVKARRRLRGRRRLC